MATLSEYLDNIEESLEINKETAEKALMLLKKTKRVIELLSDIDYYYKEKILKDEVWKENFESLLSDDEIQMTYSFFDLVDGFLQKLIELGELGDIDDI